MIYKNPIWLKSLLVLGILFFPAFTILSCIFAFHDMSENFLSSAIYLTIAPIFGYFAFEGFRLSKFINVEISVQNDGIQTKIGKEIKQFGWHQIGRVKNYKAIQLYKVYSKENQLVFIVDHMLPGFTELEYIIEDKTGI